MLGLALPALAVGTAAMWWNKHIHGSKHFTTWHSWFGLACVGWVVSSRIEALSSQLPPRSHKKVSAVSRLPIGR